MISNEYHSKKHRKSWGIKYENLSYGRGRIHLEQSDIYKFHKVFKERKLKGGMRKMVEISLKLPEDLRWVLEKKENLKFLESVLIQRLCEIKLGDLLTEKSELKKEDIDHLDHLIKKGLLERVR